MYIKRHMERLLEQITTQYPVLLVTGPRQVGKTTMLEHLAQKDGQREAQHQGVGVPLGHVFCLMNHCLLFFISFICHLFRSLFFLFVRISHRTS